MKTRSEARLQVGQQAPDAECLDEEGRPVHLGRLWKQGSVVVAFLRHYG